jgi:hypothetical protein
MFTSSSPTISAPPSPSTFHGRNYHGSRRTSSSSAASPRFQMSTASSRRAHHPHSTSAPSPVPLFARSPHTRKREYTDSATQYTPPDYPPTYRAPPPETTTAFVPPPATAIAQGERGETSAVAVVTEPVEPALRVDPLPAVSTQNVPTGRKTPREGEGGGDAQRGHQRVRPEEANTASQEQPSLAKRPRSLNADLKIMPLKYETCDVKDLGILISDMLMELVRLNDEMPLRDGQLTRFHSRY